MRLLSPIRRLGAIAACLALFGCGEGVLAPEGQVGKADRLLMLDALAIMLAIVVPTILATLAFAWWFREGNKRARYRPDFAYSGRIEILTWSIPLLTIVFLGGLIWTGSHRLDPAQPLSKEKPLEVQVVALDWKWLFIYPEQRVASVNRLVIPAGQPVHFAITSASVMNTFFVPRLGSQIYAMNGMATNLNLQADRPGVFRGQSSHYSGDGFSDMMFRVYAVPPAEFGGWVNRVRGQRPGLDARSYGALAKQSHDVRPFDFGTADPQLFNRVVMQSIPPAAGPEQGRGGPQVSPQGQS